MIFDLPCHLTPYRHLAATLCNPSPPENIKDYFTNKSRKASKDDRSSIQPAATTNYSNSKNLTPATLAGVNPLNSPDFSETQKSSEEQQFYGQGAYTTEMLSEEIERGQRQPGSGDKGGK